MAPLHKHINHIFSDLAFGKDHLEDLVPKHQTATRQIPRHASGDMMDRNGGVSHL